MPVEIWQIMIGVNLGFEFWAASQMPLSVPNLGAFMFFLLACVLFLFFIYPRSRLS